MIKKLKFIYWSLFFVQLNPFVISCVKNGNFSNQKNAREYFSNLDRDKETNKLPYKISNFLRENYATPISVNYVNDGDTFTDTKGNKYRFAGIDTPESFFKKGGIFLPTTGLQKKYATLAYQFTEYYVLNGLLPSYSKYKKRPTQIYVVPQKTKNGKTNISDSYGRIVAIIYYKDEFGKYHCLNEKLILEGKARMHYISLSKISNFYTNNKSFFKLLEDAQQIAKKKNKGIWDIGLYNEIFPNS